VASFAPVADFAHEVMGAEARAQALRIERALIRSGLIARPQLTSVRVARREVALLEGVSSHDLGPGLRARPSFNYSVPARDARRQATVRAPSVHLLGLLFLSRFGTGGLRSVAKVLRGNHASR